MVVKGQGAPEKKVSTTRKRAPASSRLRLMRYVCSPGRAGPDQHDGALNAWILEDTLVAQGAQP